MSTVDVDALADAVAARLTAPTSTYVNAKGAAAILNVPESWVLAEARARRIPHKRFGKYVRFSPTELERWAASR